MRRTLSALFVVALLAGSVPAKTIRGLDNAPRIEPHKTVIGSTRTGSPDGLTPVICEEIPAWIMDNLAAACAGAPCAPVCACVPVVQERPESCS